MKYDNKSQLFRNKKNPNLYADRTYYWVDRIIVVDESDGTLLVIDDTKFSTFDFTDWEEISYEEYIIYKARNLPTGPEPQFSLDYERKAKVRMGPTTPEYYLTAKKAAELSDKQLEKNSEEELKQIMAAILNQAGKSRYRGLTWENPNILPETKHKLQDLGYSVERRTYVDENDDLLITW